ncbi:DUF2442 domain-containing protein [bacterium]|nr:DUF2442 domain-containing protein [candidate division CSSED10-310 bacterium]
MDKYPKVKSVKALDDQQILVEFETGVVKRYNCKPLMDSVEFQPLKNKAFFKCVQVDPFGYGVIWNDEIDLAESELWINGRMA